jgi:ketosteroid isomerase-like protein
VSQGETYTKINRAWINLVLLLCAWSCLAQQSADEEAVWKLEHTYWEDVKALDLASYRDLWHPNFIGWPSVSPQPLGKDHITDWITANTEKGLHLDTYTLKRGASRTTGNLVVVHYWLTSVWQDKDNHGEPHTLRMTHTWIKAGKGWQIITGMSAPEPEANK